MSRIHDGQGVKANWGVAMQDGTVTPEEARQIVDAAKSAGVSSRELRESTDVMEVAGGELNRANLMHSMVLAVMQARYSRNERPSDRQQAGLETANREMLGALHNSQEAVAISDAIFAERDAQGSTRSMMIDFKQWLTGTFGGED